MSYDRQCSSCGGVCGSGGCKRENIKSEQETIAIVDAAYDLFHALDLLVSYAKDNGHITSIGMAALAKAKGQGLHKPKKQWKDDDILTVALKHDIDATWNAKLIAFSRELIG